MSPNPNQSFPVSLRENWESVAPTQDIFSWMSCSRRVAPLKHDPAVFSMSGPDPLVLGCEPLISLNPELLLPDLVEVPDCLASLISTDPTQIVPARFVFLAQ